MENRPVLWTRGKLMVQLPDKHMYLLPPHDMSWNSVIEMEDYIFKNYSEGKWIMNNRDEVTVRV